MTLNIISVECTSATEVTITFDQNVVVAQVASRPSAWRCFPTDFSVAVEAEVSAVEAVGAAVVLTTSEHTDGKSYRVRIPAQIFGTPSGDALTGMSDENYTGAGDGPIIQVIECIDERTIDVYFSEPMLEVDAIDPNNYAFTNDIAVVGVEKLGDLIYRITTTPMDDESTYSLMTTGLRDVALNALIGQTTGTLAATVSAAVADLTGAVSDSFDPGDPIAWFESAAAGTDYTTASGGVDVWVDKSGNSNDFDYASGGGSARPVITPHDGVDTVEFHVSNDGYLGLARSATAEMIPRNGPWTIVALMYRGSNVPGGSRDASIYTQSGTAGFGTIPLMALGMNNSSMQLFEDYIGDSSSVQAGYAENAWVKFALRRDGPAHFPVTTTPVFNRNGTQINGVGDVFGIFPDAPGRSMIGQTNTAQFGCRVLLFYERVLSDLEIADLFDQFDGML